MSRTANPIRLLIPPLIMLILVISGQRAGAVSTLELTGTQGEWKLSWTDPNLNLTWNGETNRPGLTKEVTFKNLDPITVIFEQTKPVPDVVQPDIVFRVLQDKAKNETRDDWNGFTLTLNETSGVKINHDGPVDNPIHPEPPHFHSSRLGANLTVDKLKFLEGADKESPTGSFILLGDGLVNVGDTLTISNFLIHEWMVEINQDTDNTKLRRFEFTEQPAPVPEPTTLLLWGTTLAGLGFAARWRQRRQK